MMYLYYGLNWETEFIGEWNWIEYLLRNKLVYVCHVHNSTFPFIENNIVTLTNDQITDSLKGLFIFLVIHMTIFNEIFIVLTIKEQYYLHSYLFIC